MSLDKIINEFKDNIIPDLEAQEEREIDPEKKKALEETIVAFRKDLRSKEIQKRLINQYTTQEYIGYICFLSQFIEFEIRESIFQYHQLLSMLRGNPPTRGRLEREPLGVLIESYEECINDPGLVSSLKDFNKLRKKAIHKLFDTDYAIEEVENEIRGELFYEDVYRKIVNPLLSYRLALSSKTAKVKHAAQMPPALSHLLGMTEKQVGIQLEEIEKNIKT